MARPFVILGPLGAIALAVVEILQGSAVSIAGPSFNHNSLVEMYNPTQMNLQSFAGAFGPKNLAAKKTHQEEISTSKSRSGPYATSSQSIGRLETARSSDNRLCAPAPWAAMVQIANRVFS